MMFVNFPIYGQFWTIRKVDSGRMFCNTYIFINNNLLSYKHWKETGKTSNAALILFLDVIVLKIYFLKLHMCVYLRMKFKICSVILTNFRQEGLILRPPRQNKPLKIPTRIEWKIVLIKWLYHREIKILSSSQIFDL